MKGNKLSVLVVENDNFQRHMIVKMLHSLNVQEVNDVNNGKDAMGIIRKQGKNPIDIVICDLSMPEMDGLEFLQIEYRYGTRIECKKCRRGSRNPGGLGHA